MADDAAAPEGELTETSTDEVDSSAHGATESQEPDDDSTIEAGPDEGAGAGVSETDAEADPSADPSAEVSAEASTEVSETAADTDQEPRKPREPMSRVKLATIVGVVSVLVLGGLVGWVGWRAYQSHQEAQQRALFLQVGKQAALNLTTIDFEHADDDVKRILDSATDTFYDDFSKRSQPFIDVVKQAKSKSTGEIAAAGLESEDSDNAQVLVAVTVKTSNAGAPDQAPRAWRMRISVRQVGDDVKVSNVEFVP